MEIKVIDKDKNIKEPIKRVKNRTQGLNRFNLTDKQMLFVKKVGEGKPPRVSAYESYNLKNPKAASTLANNVMSKPNVKEAILKIFDKKGINLEKAVEPLIKGLNAKRIYSSINGLEETDLDDLGIQMKASEKILKMMGVDDGIKDNVNTNYIQINQIHKQKYDDQI